MRIQLFAFITLLIFSNAVFACSCMRQTKDINTAVSDAFNGAASVVLAKAEFIKPPELLTVTPDTKDGAELFVTKNEITLFAEIQSWKGEHGKHFLTDIITICCTCGMSFKEGEIYLLYLYKHENKNTYGTSSCSRTKHKNLSHADIEILNKISPNKVLKHSPQKNAGWTR